MIHKCGDVVDVEPPADHEDWEGMSKADEDPAGEEQRAAQESHQTSEWGGSVKDVDDDEEDDDV